MPQLTERTDVWRMVGRFDGGKTEQPVYTRVPCLRVPISSFDKVTAALVARNTASAGESFRSEDRQSTDVFLLPSWVLVQTDDEFRRGRRTDNTGAAVPYRYTVNGVRDYEQFGYQDVIAVFCTSSQ